MMINVRIDEAQLQQSVGYYFDVLSFFLLLLTYTKAEIWNSRGNHIGHRSVNLSLSNNQSMTYWCDVDLYVVLEFDFFSGDHCCWI